MNTYAFLVKAKAKSDLKSLFCWFSAKSDSRAEREILNKLDDAEIEVGRGADYQLPVRTNLHAVDDLPAEGVLDNTWCDRYELGEDGLTWQKIATVAPVVKEEPVEASPGAIDQKADDAMEWPVAQMPMRSLLLSQFISEELTHHVTTDQRKQISALAMDTDNSYVQNLLLAAENADGFKSLSTNDVWKYTQAVKKVFPQDKRHELGAVATFTKTWVSTPHIDRGLLVKEWASGKRVTEINRTPSGANAGGGITADRKSPQTILNLEYEIALGLLARRRDFNIYNVPVDIEIQANGIMNKMDNPEWLATRELFVSTPGSLDYSRACIIATVKTTPENLWESPFRHREYLNKVMTESDHANPDPLIIEIACGTSSQPMPMQVKNDEDSEADSVVSDITNAYVDEQLAIDRGEFVPGISDPADPKWDHTTETTIQFEEAADNVQMETTVTVESKTDSEVSAGQSTDDTGAPAVTLTNAQILANAAPELAKAFSELSDTETTEESAPEYPAYFEPGRYEGLPNHVYHAANGISSTQVKDARISLMYFNARHVAKTIAREQSKVLDMGNLVHALALQPDNLEAEFSIEPVIPEGAFTTTATLRAFIDEYNAALPPQLSADDIKALLEAHNATLPAQVPMGASTDETGQSYMSLPAEFQRIEDGQKQTAAAMKACIKEYNATLPAQVKTSGSRDAMLEQLAIINPDLVAQEAQKPAPLKVSGTKAEMIQAVKSVKPDAVFADELLDAWRANPADKILVTRAQLATATAIQSALLAHPTAGKFLTHPSRAVEVSYFGFDDETGLEIRVRPDLEIDMNGVRIGFDLKTISMFNVKQPGLKAKLHREIIDRDYHLSAAMYMNTASLDQFFWIFVNKDEGYHWIAIVEASPELLELGALEYQTTMRAIANAFDTGEWPAPIVDDYADELNDFDMRRLEALREQA